MTPRAFPDRLPSLKQNDNAIPNIRVSCSGRVPRIDDGEGQAGKIAYVPGGELEAVLQRGRGNQSVGKVQHAALRLSVGAQLSGATGECPVEIDDGIVAGSEKAID